MTRARATLQAGAFLLAVAFLVLPAGSPPLYDSLRIPDEPYRYLTQTAGRQQSPPPTSARGEVGVGDPVININTAEWRPQAFLLVQTGSLRPVPGTTRIIATLTPVSLPQPGPPNGVPLGNAYQIEVRNQSGQILEPNGKGQRPVVQMRVPNASIPRGVRLELNRAGSWEALTTIHTADVIYGAELPSFGTVAAAYVVGTGAPPVQPPGNGTRPPLPVLISIVLLVIAGGWLVALAFAQRSARSSDGQLRARSAAANHS